MTYTYRKCGSKQEHSHRQISREGKVRVEEGTYLDVGMIKEFRVTCGA